MISRDGIVRDSWYESGIKMNKMLENTRFQHLKYFFLAIVPEIAYNVFAKVKKFELYSHIRRYFQWRANAVSATARTAA